MTDSLADIDNREDGETSQWLTFCVAEETYALPVMEIQEVLRYGDSAPVPGAPRFILGVVNIRGNIVTVIDIRRRFGLPPAALTDSTRIIIVEQARESIGLLVDKVDAVAYLRTKEIERSPNVGNEQAMEFIQGVYHTKEKLIILLSIGTLLTPTENENENEEAKAT